MKLVTLCHMEDSYASLNSPTTNFSKFAYLNVGGDRKGGCNQSINKALLKFDLTKINSIKDINKVELNLYVKDIDTSNDKVLINVYKNKSNFWQNEVYWNNCPEVEGQLCNFCVTKDNKNSYVTIDITSLVLKWISGKVENNGITLWTEDSSDYISFVSSRGYHAPSLKIHYKNENKNINLIEELVRDYSTNSKVENSYGLITLNNSPILETGQAITFGSANLSKGIKYLPNGEIHIKDPGQYIVNFWINCSNESVGQREDLNISLVKCINEETIAPILKAKSSETIIPGKTTVLAATGTINVREEGNKFKFINTSTSNIRIASLNENYGASVMITKIDD